MITKMCQSSGSCYEKAGRLLSSFHEEEKPYSTSSLKCGKMRERSLQRVNGQTTHLRGANINVREHAARNVHKTIATS